MNHIVEPITADGRTGFDQFGQLVNWSSPDENKCTTGIIIRDVRNIQCYICGKGWALNSEDLRDQESDNRGNMMHKTCMFGHRKMDAFNRVQVALINAGYLFECEEVPPRYPHSTPWQRVQVLHQYPERSFTGTRLVLGRRKRVWELRIHGQGDMSQWFDDVDDTKGYNSVSELEPEYGPYYYVHAWTDAQLTDYLLRVRLLIPNSDRNSKET